MAYGVRISEATNIVGTIQTASGTGTYASDVWSLSSQYGRRFIAYVNIGVIGSSGTVAYTFQVSTTSTGTYTSVTGGAIESNIWRTACAAPASSVAPCGFAPVAGMVSCTP